MKTPKVAVPKSLDRLNTPKSGMIKKKNVKQGPTPFKGNAGTLQLLKEEFANRSPSDKVKRRSVKSSPEIELGLKIEDLLQKGVASPPNSSEQEGNIKTRRKSMMPTSKALGTPLKMQKRFSLGSALTTGKPSTLGGKKSVTIAKGSKNSQTPKLKSEQPAKSDAGHTPKIPKRPKGSPNNARQKTIQSKLEDIDVADGAPTVEEPPPKGPVSPAKKGKKGKKKKGKAGQQAVSKQNGDVPKGVERAAEKPKLLAYDSVKGAVESLLNSHKTNAAESKKLLADVPYECLLTINCIKSPITPTRFLRVAVPNRIVAESADVCLIVGDLAKAKKDPKVTKAHYQEILDKAGIKWVKEIIPLRALSTEYTQYEQRRRLAQRFDMILVEGKISFRIYKLIGKFLFSMRRIPIPVGDVTSKVQLENALKKAVFQLKSGKNTFTFQVGHTQQPAEEIAQNVMSVADTLASQFPGGWKNIRSIFGSTSLSQKMPIYISLLTKNQVERPVSTDSKMRPRPITDELSTVPGSEVTVYPDGRVIVKRGREDSSDEEDNGEEEVEEKEKKPETEASSEIEANVESEETGNKEDVEEDSSEEENVKVMPKNKKKNLKGKKGKGAVQKPEEKDSSDEENIEEAEEEYLRDLVEKHQETKGKVEKMQPNLKKSPKAQRTPSKQSNKKKLKV